MLWDRGPRKRRGGKCDILPDFEIITRKFPERDDITLVAVGDVHLGSRECQEQKFMEFLKMVERTPNVYLVLLGDLLDNVTKTSVGSVFESVYRPSEAKKIMAELLRPVKDRVLCAVQGNHEARSEKDADDCPLYDVLCKLDIEDVYRRNLAILRIMMGDNRKSEGKRNPVYILAVTHGNGGGALTGSSVNRNERFAYAFDGIDALITGHTHKPVLTAPGKIKVDASHNRVYITQTKVLTATSWLDYGGYAMKKMLLPSTHCLQTMQLAGKHKEIIVTM